MTQWKVPQREGATAYTSKSVKAFSATYVLLIAQVCIKLIHYIAFLLRSTCYRQSDDLACCLFPVIHHCVGVTDEFRFPSSHGYITDQRTPKVKI